MQRYNIKVSNFPYIFGGLFILTSLIFMTISFAMGYSTIKTKKNADTFAIASRIELNSYSSRSSNGSRTVMYSPTFFYTVNNKEYSCSTNLSTSIKPKLDNSKVFYNSKNPNDCISEYHFTQSIIMICITLLVSIPLFIVGLTVFMFAIIRRIKNRKLKQHGQLIKNIPCTILPSNITMNNKRGYIIEVEYEGVKLKSETKFDIDPRRNAADLLIDPLNPKNYFIDFDIVETL